MFNRQRLQIALLAALSCSGCERYVVSVNDNEVYTPPPAFIGNTFTDPALKRCVTRHFGKQQLTRAEQLIRLSCRDAGVQSLDGIRVLTQLQSLDLVGNGIVDLQPLLALASLKSVNLLNNPLLNCNEVRQLAETGVMVTHPEQCTAL